MSHTHHLQDLQEHKNQLVNSFFSVLRDHLPLNTSILESKLEPLFEPLLQSLVDSFVKKLNLVSRQEFDIQSQVLLRTRLKIERLEQEVEKLYQIQQNLIPVSELNQK